MIDKGTYRERTLGDIVLEMAEIKNRLREFDREYLKIHGGNYQSLFKRMYPDIYKEEK